MTKFDREFCSIEEFITAYIEKEEELEGRLRDTEILLDKLTEEKLSN